jgi:hypothetical protein
VIPRPVKLRSLGIGFGFGIGFSFGIGFAPGCGLGFVPCLSGV